TLKNWRDLFSRLIALWWLSGIARSIIAIEAPHPLRMIVALVPTAILVALGLINFSIWLESRVRYQVSSSTVAEEIHIPYPMSRLSAQPPPGTPHASVRSL